MDRRTFVKYSLASAATVSVLPTSVAAFGPLFFLRFLFSRAAVRALGRGAPRSAVTRASAARASNLRTLKSYKNPRKMYPASALLTAGVELGGITALSPELFKIVVNNNATTIWVIDDERPEEFFVTGRNNTSSRISAPLAIAYNELGVTGKPTQYFNHGDLTVDPHEEFAIKLSPPNELGGMRLVNLHGQLLGVDNDKVEFEQSDAIVIASSWEVAK